ncbi:MAG: hypothetical protein AB7S77_23835, partial [Desulfatirhabdiaceae bacterium]
WSQLRLAQGQYPDAEILQKQAIQKLKPEEMYRNLGYLAQIQFRSGRLNPAKKHLDEALKQLDKLDEVARKKGRPFFDWFFSEFCYRKLVSLKSQPGRASWMASLEQMIDLYPEVVNYPHALIYKFAGLASLAQGDESTGLSRLSQSIQYLETCATQPTIQLLGVTARAVRVNYRIHRKQLDEVRNDMVHIRNVLRSRKDIGHFFQPEIDALAPCLRSRRVAAAHLESVQQAISRILNKIPY